MIKNALRDFKINTKKSFFVGDMTRDILTGKRAGLKTILVRTGHGGRDGKHDVKPDYVVRDLAAAVKVIRKHV